MDKQSLNKLIEDVGYMRGSFDTTIKNLNITLENINSELKDNGKRIAIVENKQAGLVAVVSLIASGIGIVVGFVSNYLANLFTK